MNILGLAENTKLLRVTDYFKLVFQAMACDCEILVDTDDLQMARECLEIACAEAGRIERKYSRYQKGNLIDQINTAAGRTVEVDDETAKLLDFADQCWHLSGGMFDITSGILRKAWQFNGTVQKPQAEKISQLLSLVGWKKAKWNRPSLTLLPGMEIDLGGIGKEYAVDRVRGLLEQRFSCGFLINFGGDIVVGGKRRGDQSWLVGIETVTNVNEAERVLSLKEGAVATSGDTKKFTQVNGKRGGHILDPRSGWPVLDAPRTVTVAAETCTEAGFLSTFGILSGKQAGQVLNEAGVQYWCSF